MSLGKRRVKARHIILYVLLMGGSLATLAGARCLPTKPMIEAWKHCEASTQYKGSVSSEGIGTLEVSRALFIKDICLRHVTAPWSISESRQQALKHAIEDQWDLNRSYYVRARRSAPEDIGLAIDHSIFLQRNQLYRTAIYVLKDTLKRHENAASKSQLAEIWHYLGNLYSDEEKYPEAFDAYKRAKQIRQQEQNNCPGTRFDLSTTLTNLASIQLDNDLYQDARKSLARSYKLRNGLTKSVSDHFGHYLATTLRNRAVLYEHLNKPVLAKKDIQESLRIYESLTSTFPRLYLMYRSQMHKEISASLEARDEHVSALESIDAAISIDRFLIARHGTGYKAQLMRHLVVRRDLTHEMALPDEIQKTQEEIDQMQSDIATINESRLRNAYPEMRESFSAAAPKDGS
jgi:tetratricopeptide (TPR) repeat protein